LGDLIDIFDSVRIPLNSRQRAERRGNYPYYGASGIIDSVDDYLFNGEYVLIAEDGENLNSRKLPVAFIARGKFWVNNHAHIIKGKSGVADDRFLVAWFAQAHIKGYITGAAQPKLSQANLKRITLTAPPLPTQRKIAGVLSAYDDLIENNSRRIAILEEMAQAIYREWFVNFRFPGHENVKLIDSPLGKIPEGWRVANLFDIAEISYGFPYKSKQFTTTPEGKPVIRIRDILGHRSETYTNEDAGTKYIVKDGDILIGMDGDFHMCRWAGGDAVLNQRVARLRTKNELPQYVLFHCVREPILHFNATIVGTTVAHLGDKHLREINVVCPPMNLLINLHAIFEPLFFAEINLRKKIELLRSTRDLLLPKLISGQLDVEDLDIDIGEQPVEATT
jgi:type I restriction enzyme S subunit